MHSYKEEVSLPMHIVEDRKAGERRPMRVAVVASSLALMACVAVLMVSGEGNRGTAISLAEVGKPKFVDWKKEDAGSDDMNLHLKVADALAKVGPTPNTTLRDNLRDPPLPHECTHAPTHTRTHTHTHTHTHARTHTHRHR